MSERIKGLIQWFSARKGYGFLCGPENQDVFVHFSQINMEGYKTLDKGQEVEYELVHSDRGPQAHGIVPVG